METYTEYTFRMNESPNVASVLPDEMVPPLVTEPTQYV
jgi:hypothetical protein